MKESEANELKRLRKENAQLKARLQRAHKNHDELLGGHLIALRALPPSPTARPRVDDDTAYSEVVKCILAQPGVNPANINGAATMSDLAVAPSRVGACVNGKFKLNPPIRNNEINENTTVGTIAFWVVTRS
jgi:hypothetical protein